VLLLWLGIWYGLGLGFSIGDVLRVESSDEVSILFLGRRMMSTRRRRKWCFELDDNEGCCHGGS